MAAPTPGRRQIVGALFHLADREPCRRLNDTVCVCTSEVRTPSDPAQPEPDLVIDVTEVIWQPIAGCHPGRPPRLPMPVATAGHFTAARPQPAILKAIAESPFPERPGGLCPCSCVSATGRRSASC
jgi:hypothetical protein